jgi:uncharacterized membrane protein
MKLAVSRPASMVMACALGLFVAPGIARAGLEICNDTQARQTVAIGYKQGDDWVSEGWWNIDPGACSTPVSGDLKNRYYYYLSKSSGWEFMDGNIAFCTESDVFTIVGDQDCAQRGYEKSLFRKIDTGKTARQFTHNLAAFTKPITPEHTPAQPQAPGTEPGTWGEPYASGAAVFQSCVYETEAPFCTFHADGYKFFVNDDGRTPQSVMDRLHGLLPGAPIDVSGDLVGVYDRTADVVLRRAAPRQPNDWDRILSRMQGQWYSESDPAEMFTILGAEKTNTYDGAYIGLDYLSMGDTCENYQGGPFLRVSDETMDDVLCYSVEEMADWSMTWMYLPRGNFHRYRKLE